MEIILPRSGNQLFFVFLDTNDCFLEKNPYNIEIELFSRIAQGDETAFKEIFDSYSRSLFPFIFSLIRSKQDTLEVLQEMFLRLWTQRASLGAVDNPGAWIRTLASYVAYDYLRKEIRHQCVEAELEEDPALSVEDVWDKLQMKELKSILHEAVEQLPARRRQIFTMSKLEGRSRCEIADTLHISENTVRNQLVEAMHFIQQYLLKYKQIHIPGFLLWWFL